MFCLTETDWIALGTVGTFLLAIAAFVTLFIQGKQFNKLRIDENERSFKNSSVMLILDFDKQFYELEDIRTETGKLILENKLLEADIINYKILQNGLGEIYDFFDTLGFFVTDDYIKPEVVHQYFYYWFTHYYAFYKSYDIKRLSDYDETVWINLSKLSKELDKIERKQLGKEREKIDKDTLIKFFTEEAWNDD